MMRVGVMMTSELVQFLIYIIILLTLSPHGIVLVIWEGSVPAG